MALSQEQESLLQEIRKDTRLFEASLRTSFRIQNPDNHVTIQRVTNDCNTLKRKIQSLVALNITGSDAFRVSSVLDSAIFYVRKYEMVLTRGLTLDGDILVLAGKIG